MEPTEDLTAAVAHIAAAGRAIWPDVDLPDAALAEHVARHRKDDPDAALPPSHAGDYYLAAALAKQLAPAVRAFERVMVPEIDAALRQRARDDEPVTAVVARTAQDDDGAGPPSAEVGGKRLDRSRDGRARVLHQSSARHAERLRAAVSPRHRLGRDRR